MALAPPPIYLVHSEDYERPPSNVSSRYEKGAALSSRQVESVIGSQNDRPQIAEEVEVQQPHSGDCSVGEAARTHEELMREMSALRNSMHRVLAERVPALVYTPELGRPPSYSSNPREQRCVFDFVVD